jgi:hypothetical protein
LSLILLAFSASILSNSIAVDQEVTISGEFSSRFSNSENLTSKGLNYNFTLNGPLANISTSKEITIPVLFDFNSFIIKVSIK